jgi:hypothetical protein
MALPDLPDAFAEKMKIRKGTPARTGEADTRHEPLGILLAQAIANNNTYGSEDPISENLIPHPAGCLAAEGQSLRRRSGGG